MPPVNYGQGGANQLGDMPVHPGTYAIRQSTLRSLVADLGGQVAQNGFKWIFVMNGHGAPTHNIAINEACDFVSETFGVTMLHLTGLFRADAAIQSSGARINAKYFSAAELSCFGMDVHAGVGETSGMLAVRPDLVRPNYRNAPQPGGALAGRAARNSDCSRLAGLFVFSCEGDGGARPSGRGMVDRRVHGSDPPRCWRGKYVRPSACPRDGASAWPRSREGTGERSGIRGQARGLADATQEAVVNFVPVSSVYPPCQSTGERRDERPDRRHRLCRRYPRATRYALRTFRRAPLVAFTIVSTVALGLGLVAVAFTMLNSLLFRVDQVPNVHEMFAVERTRTSGGEGQEFTRAEFDALRLETKSSPMPMRS